MPLTHEERMLRAIKFNEERKAGIFAGQLATGDKIRADQLSEEDIARLVAIYDDWQADKAYGLGDLVAYQGALYQVITAHTSQAGWEPPAVPALFKAFTAVGTIAEWVQPAGAHDAYQIGDKVLFEGSIYESLIDANTWSPTAYPQGWQLIE